MINQLASNTSGLYSLAIEKSPDVARHAPKAIELQQAISADGGPSATPAHLLYTSQLLKFQSEYLLALTTDMEGGDYAYVYRGEEKIGKISNTGSLTLPMMFPYPHEGPAQGGPELAQWRADKLSEMGLQVRLAESAIPRDQWSSWRRPSISEALDAYVSSRFEALAQEAASSREA